MAAFRLPIYAGALDVVENTLLLTQLSDPDNLSGLVLFTASIAASIKFLLLIATAGLIVYFLYAAVTKRAHAG